ncbi:MAG: EAL domain-containing protein [Gammaproteobacteria bacterium]
MKDDTHILISLGFMTVVALMFSLVFISLVQLQSINKSLTRTVEHTNAKIHAAHRLRDAVRLRGNALNKMLVTEDAFERDGLEQSMLGYGGMFLRARNTLLSMDMDPDEQAIHRLIDTVSRDGQRTNRRVAELLTDFAPREEIDVAMAQAEESRTIILEAVDSLVELEENNARTALSENQQHYLYTRRLLLILSAITLAVCLLIAVLVIKRARTRNRLLAYHASHDSLTGLINRREFETRVKRVIENARAQATTHTLLYMDLDQFKVINDTCGHAAGDELLQQLSQLLHSTVRKRDTLSRLGGDEFGMLLDNCPLDKGVEVADKLLKILDEFQFVWDSSTFTLGISIGVIPIDRSTRDISSVMSAADSACHIAKESGRNQIQIAYLGDPRIQERHGQMRWVSRLTKALDEGRFALYFQPIIPCAGSVHSEKHIEILLRMIDEDGSIIAPGAFLPAAEKFNLIAGIDRWVVSTAMRWLTAERTSGCRPVMISINLSGQTVSDPGMLQFIMDQLAETGACPEQICFEITETAAIANITAATRFMLTLRGCGIRFSLDDFGSGLSSFTYLKKLPVDFLKIDGVFVRDILSDPVDHAMVKSINELGQLLGKETIAEFVETLEIAEELRRIGVNYAQGYAYGHPLPLEKFAHAVGPRLVVG